MTAALSTGKTRLRCMISVGVGGASVGLRGVFLWEDYSYMGGFVSLCVAFVIGEAVLLLGFVATEGGISCGCLKNIEIMLFSPGKLS